MHRPWLKPRRTLGLLLVSCLAWNLVTPAWASVLPAEEDAAAAALRDLPGTLAVPAPELEPGDPDDPGDDVAKPGGKSLWIWSAGRRGFQIADASPSTSAGFETVVAYNLDTNEEVARAKVAPRIFRGKAAPGMPHTADVGDADGVFVLGYETPGLSESSQGTVSNTLRPGSSQASLTQRGPEAVCALVDMSCFGGLVVLDARTLEPRRRIAFTPLSADAGALGATLRALRYVEPGEGGARKGKVLAVVEEWVHTPLGVSQVEQPRYQGLNIVYVVQFDPETGTQDWAVRADGCRGAREPKDAGSVGDAQFRPHPAAVFRTFAGPEGATPAVLVACHSGSSQTGAVVKIPLSQDGYPEVLPAEPGDTEALVEQASSQQQSASERSVVVQHAAQQLYTGPDKVWEVFPDPESGRVLMKVVDGNPNAEVWWVFDSRREQFVGTVGIGAFGPKETMAALDEANGRLYVVAPQRSGVGYPGGIFVVDTRRTPLAQALVFPAQGRDPSGGPPAVDPASARRAARLYTRVADDLYRVVEDTLPVSADLPLETYAGRSLDLDEAEGVTQAAFDGAARGYGLRALLVGGADAALRTGPADPTGQWYGTQEAAIRATASTLGAGTQRELGLPVTSPCTESSREVVLGAVGPAGPAVVDSSGGRAAAEPIVADTSLRTDSEKPLSRCSPADWTELWSKALFSSPPAPEPTAEWPFGAGTADCVSSTDTPSATFSDPTTGWFSAAVECEPEQISGWSRARAITLDGAGLTVAEASSRFTVYRDPARGVVSRVESVARGIELAGVLRVDSVRVIAESWANGRRQPVDDAQREEGYEPNCDLERSAGSCYRRSVTGVWTPGWSCGPCGDEPTMIDRLNRAMGAQGKVALREPDPRMARGAANGFIAAIQKPDHERFADLVLNNDLLQTVVPGLEIIRYTAPNRTVGGGGPRGRQVYQFAGAEVSSSYGISCLLVYDEATNTCAEPAEAPGSIVVSLSDSDGEPLAGGAFEVRQDVDTDGVLGLKDTLLANGACVTADDGVGTCTLDNLQPGAYLVSQVAAPPGYAKSAEPFVVDLASGEQRSVAFTNVSNVSTVDVKATDENGAPVSGATFAAYPDGDSDGKVAPDAKPAAECTTDAQGVCQMKVPAGSYVLVQTSAPGGLEGIEPVPFTFASGGQVASVSVVNYSPAGPEQPAPEAAPIDYTPPVDYSPPVEIVDDSYTPVDEAPVVQEPAVSVPERIGGTVTQVIRAPGDALRLLARDPMQAAAWVASLALFVIAVLAVRRRQTAAELSRVSNLPG